MSHGVFEYFSVFAFSSAPQVSFFLRRWDVLLSSFYTDLS